MNKFKVISDFTPQGDQPKAIQNLKNGVKNNLDYQTLMGITGSGKSATIAWLIEELQMPSLVLAPNKALAAQLANEFKQFFPENRVEYFVSYYDYYQPEAYVPRTDTFIEKDSNINEEIDRLRHSATSALLLRKDVIVVSSVSCIYGLGSPQEYKNKIIPLYKGEEFELDQLLEELIRQQYVRNDPEISDKNRIHTTYNLFGTTTGRLSSEKPNLQNIPNKTEIGQKIREFFIADTNHKFVISDYSQIELRVLAHLSSDKNMLDILSSINSDIHTETASRIFEVSLESVTKDMRRKAKEVNFGLIYGMEAFGLSKSLGISKNESQGLIDAYFSQFPKIKGFLDTIVSDAEHDGYTKTLYGRKRNIKELSSSNFQLKAMGKRIAMNAPIQGTAADIMKIAMLKV